MVGEVITETDEPRNGPVAPAMPEGKQSLRGTRARLTGLFLLTLISVFALIGLVYFAAQRQNDVALDNTRHVMGSIFGAMQSDLGRQVYDYVWWDVAIENLFPKPDGRWIEDNIGLYAANTFGLSWSVVVNEKNEFLFVGYRGDPQNFDFEANTEGGFFDLVAKARAAPMEEPGIATGYLMINGKLNVVAVGTFTPENPTKEQLKRRARPVLAFAKSVDQDLLDRIAADYRIDGLQLTPPGPVETGAALPLYLVDGTYAGNLVSRPLLPGQAFIKDTMPWLGVFAVVLVSTSLFFLVRTRRAIADSAERQTQLSDTNLALKFSEGRVRDFAESASDWFWETDSDLRVTFVSERFTEITGLPIGEIIGQRMPQFFADSRFDNENGGRQDLAELTGKRLPIRNLRVRWSGPGPRLYLHISATPTFDADRRFLGYRGTGTDITARVNAENAQRRHRDELEHRVAERTAELEAVNKVLLQEIDVRGQVETELRQSENRYRQLVEHSPDAIAVFQNSGCVFANGAALRLFGTDSIDAVTGKKIGDLLPPHSDSDRIQLELLADTASLAPQSVRYFDKEEQTREADAMSAETTFSGMPAILLILRDVTEGKVAQRQLAQAAKLVTLGEMAAGMAHEMRQPLNIIRMAADSSTMMIEQGDDDTEHYAQEFTVISGQCERMADIIDHMQVFGRGETGDAVTFNPSETVQYATAMLQRQFRLDDIRIHLDAPAQVRPIFGFPVRLEQVMVNLLNNARDAILDNNDSVRTPDPEDRLVTVSVRDEAGGDFVEIIVEDTGGGIDQAIIGRIFDPFFSTKAAGAGTGLGLSIVYGIVTDMGGTIEAANAERGTRFTVRFPVVSETGGAAKLSDGAA